MRPLEDIDLAVVEDDSEEPLGLPGAAVRGLRLVLGLKGNIDQNLWFFKGGIFLTQSLFWRFFIFGPFLGAFGGIFCIFSVDLKQILVFIF